MKYKRFLNILTGTIGCVYVLIVTVTEYCILLENEKLWMTVEQFCNNYSISKSTFYKEVKSKRLKITKLKSRTYVTKKNGEAWIALLETVPT